MHHEGKGKGAGGLRVADLRNHSTKLNVIFSIVTCMAIIVIVVIIIILLIFAFHIAISVVFFACFLIFLDRLSSTFLLKFLFRTILILLLILLKATDALSADSLVTLCCESYT